MERSTFSTFSSLFTAVLLAAAVALGGCSNSITGAQPQDQEVAVQKQAEHNQTEQLDGGGSVDTKPSAGHNTSNED